MPEPLIGIEDYRRQAGKWLTANLPRRDEVSRPDFDGASDEELRRQIDAERAVQRRLYDAGYAGITWPVEYGGQGLPEEYERAFAAEARGFRLPDFGIAGGTTFGVCARTMLAHGSPAFLRRHLPRILAGEELFVQFFSDPEAGSDLAGVRTQAVRDGDRWLLSGSKIWSSGAYYADWGMCLARTDWDAPKHRGLTWFAVPVRAAGVTVQRIRQITGSAEFCQEFFDDVVLTDDDVIGEVNDGWTVTQTMLLFERGGGGEAQPRAGGDARRLPADLVELARSVGTLDDAHTQQLITRAHVDDVVRDQLMTRIGALMRLDPRLAAGVASYGKLASATFDPVRANLALEIANGAASSWNGAGTPAARVVSDLLSSRFMAIAGGTSEMQRNSIGERVLGLPREPSFDSGKPFREVVRDAQNWSGKVS
ncbi:acyl-CoA dehydrogenase family protein [Frankia sp. CNm7]|uniref:Acyl-CoA dehydrogenase family protein n=1 Tax=Frankia nepalensis TaxID=1836974 RepID=A0A937RJ43_9ACTN|nr:acyl-CoA dehydrogenase family protein [Frankia nepalensis]MBL7498699.1 acyl-CoA dehydrogenase family protein [Frankia nepalensis]MBL7512921.1 acyl-CoA dehydrogenase family protein [Frankia nepalensis]MBL7521655.1 acyl-CoA dehydrogenase family protein [Frankia nepalensis]MBL7633216.1 acyl-CoA dehydrogenase family protein [Frankia nepalensis]